MLRFNEISPCIGCSRVRDPESCENKNCLLWRRWFLSQWEIIHSYPRRIMDGPARPAGVTIGGNCYAAPHQVRTYLHTDPCSGCVCGRDLCHTPCRARQSWAKAGGVA